MKFYKALLLFILLLSLTANAQGPGHRGKGDRDPVGMMIQSLDLSPEQLAQIKELRKVHFDKMKARRSEMKAGGRQMLQMMSATETEDSLRASYKKFQSLREEVDKERFEMMLSIRKLLTDEQKKKASELMKKHQERMEARMKDGPPMMERP